MTLRPPRDIVPGACVCVPEGCLCAPADLGERMTQMSEAKYRADAARERGDLATAAHHTAERRRLSASIDEALTLKPAPRPTRSDTMTTTKTATERATIIAQIISVQAECMRHVRYDAASENLESKSDAYLDARLASLQEWRAKNAASTGKRLHHDALGTLRVDSAPDPADLQAARHRVFYSGVPEAQRESVVHQIASCTAWRRNADRAVFEHVRLRMDSAPPAPTTQDRSQARRELEPRIPMGADRTDAYAAAAHESAIEERARQIATKRTEDEYRNLARASLPPAPRMPDLPPMPLSGGVL